METKSNKSKWIAIGVVLLILTIIGIIWYRNRKFINKVPVESKKSVVTAGKNAGSSVNMGPANVGYDAQVATGGRGPGTTDGRG